MGRALAHRVRAEHRPGAGAELRRDAEHEVLGVRGGPGPGVDPEDGGHQCPDVGGRTQIGLE